MDEKKTKKGKAVEEEQVTEESAVSETEALQKEIEELKKQVEDYKDKWMRNVAEFAPPPTVVLP